MLELKKMQKDTHGRSKIIDRVAYIRPVKMQRQSELAPLIYRILGGPLQVPIPELLSNAVQQKIYESLHDEGTAHEAEHRVRGPTAIRVRRGNGVRLRFPVIVI